MEEKNNQNTFIIQTVDLNSVNSAGDLSKECVLNDAQILISTTELNNASRYITCYENGEIVLKEIEDSIMKKCKNKNEIVTLAKTENKPLAKLNTNSACITIDTQELDKLQQKQTIKSRKKLCYEKPYNVQPLTMQSKHDVQSVSRYPRKQLIDHKIMISPREFKCQLNYTADTITSTKLAPCTRQQLVHVLNGITTLFAHPAHKMPNANLMQLYVSRCTCKKEPNMMSTEDMNLLPLIENITRPSSNNINPPVRKIYGKRKNNSGISLETQKVQIVENIKEPNKLSPDLNSPDSNINLSSIKKIYRNRKCNKESLIDNEKQQIIQNENIDHKYSKKLTNEQQLDKIKNEEPQCEDDTIYAITLDIDDIKEEHINENQIVILSVDNDGELTENNISVLLDAANTIKTELTKDAEKEVVALTKNVGTDDFNNRLSKIFVIRTNNDNNESGQILGDISDLNTS